MFSCNVNAFIHIPFYDDFLHLSTYKRQMIARNIIMIKRYHLINAGYKISFYSDFLYLITAKRQMITNLFINKRRPMVVLIDDNDCLTMNTMCFPTLQLRYTLLLQHVNHD